MPNTVQVSKPPTVLRSLKLVGEVQNNMKQNMLCAGIISCIYIKSGRTSHKILNIVLRLNTDNLYIIST